MVGAWLAGTSFTINSFVLAFMTHVGRQVWDIPLDKFEIIAMLSWLAQLAFLVTGACTKISVLLFYRRLVKDTYAARWKWAVITAILFTAAYTIAFIFVLIFNCSPTEAYWKSFDPLYTASYTCVDTTVINLLAGILAIVSDAYSIALPCLMTRHFQLPGRQKAALNVLFSLAVVVVAASAIRTYYLWQVGNNPNVSPMVFDATVAAQFELQIGIVCASLPALRVFFRKYLSGSAVRSAFSATRSQTSRNSTRTPLSIKRISGPDDHFGRDDFSTKNLKSTDEGAMTVIEEEDELAGASPTSYATSSHNLIKSPAEYEVYNMQQMQHYRESVEKRQVKDGPKSFSQPFSNATAPSQHSNR